MSKASKAQEAMTASVVALDGRIERLLTQLEPSAIECRPMTLHVPVERDVEGKLVTTDKIATMMIAWITAFADLACDIAQENRDERWTQIGLALARVRKELRTIV